MYHAFTRIQKLMEFAVANLQSADRPKLRAEQVGLAEYVDASGVPQLFLVLSAEKDQIAALRAPIEGKLKQAGWLDVEVRFEPAV